VSFIDAHTHSHLRGTEDLQAMAQAGVGGLVVCAYLPVRLSHPTAVEDLWRWLLTAETKRLEGAGLAARVAVGIHPRCIPDQGIDGLLDSLARVLGSGAAAAVGEIGLEANTPVEHDLLERQLRLAQRLGVPAIVHTPRERKEPALDATLALVAGLPDPGRVVIDHLTPEFVGRVRAAGAVAGVTVQPRKATPRDVEEVVRRHGAAGIVVDSDMSQAPSDPLALPHVAAHLQQAGLAPDAIAAVTGENARRLFGF
jgi:uncharacterized protein